MIFGKGKVNLYEPILHVSNPSSVSSPSFDKDWAKTQFVWGLHTRVAELVVIAGPADLHAAI